MIFACNELPTVYDNSVGFWDRWILIQFPYTFVTQKEYDEAREKSNLKVRDEQIIEKIITDDELSGFLNKLLDNLDDLLKNRNFTYSNNADQVKTIWIRKSSSVTAFCMDKIIEDGLGIITKKEFRKRYLEYCKLHRIPTQTDKTIKDILQELYGVTDDRKVLFGSMDSEYVWIGISFKNKDVDAEKC
jgi:putative DNA primase/helicase